MSNEYDDDGFGGDYDGYYDNDFGGDSDGYFDGGDIDDQKLVVAFDQLQHVSVAELSHMTVRDHYTINRTIGDRRQPIRKAPKNTQTYFYIVSKFLNIKHGEKLQTEFIIDADLEHLEKELFFSDTSNIKFEEMNYVLLLLGHALYRQVAKSNRVLNQQWLSNGVEAYPIIDDGIREDADKEPRESSISEKRASVVRYYKFWDSYYIKFVK